MNHDEMDVIDCTEVKLLLGRFFDGELEAEQAAPVEEHMRRCRGCEAALQALREIDRMLDIGLPQGALDRCLAEAIGKKPASGWWLGAAAAAAVIPLALGAVAGSLLLNDHAQPQSQAVTTASLLEESFGPGSLRGFDELARDLDQKAKGDR